MAIIGISQGSMFSVQCAWAKVGQLLDVYTKAPTGSSCKPKAHRPIPKACALCCPRGATRARPLTNSSRFKARVTTESFGRGAEEVEHILILLP
eukprot:scaffold75401_cov33-Tisochrysis_lutea.AAC.1